MSEALRPARAIFRALTSYEHALERLVALAAPVPIRTVPLPAAIGAILAEPISIDGPIPSEALAGRDGYAVFAADTLSATAQAPLRLSALPPFVEMGAKLPNECDAVLPPAAIVSDGVFAEAIAEALPGEGVIARAHDVEAVFPLAQAGMPVVAEWLPVLSAAGLTELNVRRPIIHLLPARDCGPFAGGVSCALVARQIARFGGSPIIEADMSRPLVAALGGADAMVIVGGTGEGPSDETFRRLAAEGEVDCAGIGMEPGGTSGFGRIGGKPVLALPGRPEAALAAALLLAGPLCAALAGASSAKPEGSLPLARKVVSGVGVTELRFVGRKDGLAIPLGGAPLPLAALAGAEGYIVIPSASEGIAAGSHAPIYRL
jgi:molybdopterin biosynthesis enzyme